MTIPNLIVTAFALLGGLPTPTVGFIEFPTAWDAAINDSCLTPAAKRALFVERWRQEFDALAAMKFNAVIVHYTMFTTLDNKHLSTSLYFGGEVTIGGKTFVANPHDVSSRSLDVILKQAEAHGIDVWIGLRQRWDWDSVLTWPEVVDRKNEVIAETLAVARGLKASHLLDSPRFAGWYLPPEIGNNSVTGNPQSPSEPAALRTNAARAHQMFHILAAALKHIANKPVAISGFFRTDPSNMDESQYFDYIGMALARSGIGVLLFQDGIGVLDSNEGRQAHVTNQQAIVLRSHHALAIATCLAIGVVPWADVEVFAGPGADQSALASRVADQLELAAAYPRRVIFDVTNNLTPFGTEPGSAALFADIYQWLAGHAYHGP